MTKSRESRLIEKLELREFKLKALLEVTRAINSQSSEEDLLNQYSKALQTYLGISRIVLYALDLGGAFWRLLVSTGVSGFVPETQPAHFFEKLNSGGISIVGSDGLDNHAFDVVVPVSQNDEVIAFVLAGDEKEDARGMSPVVKHLNFLQTLTNILVVALRNRELVDENLRQEGLKRELELAGEMQSLLVPKSWPVDAQIDVSGYYQPHHQIGGDYYDCFEWGDDCLVICMADVSGKGIGAALLMSNFQANVKAIFQGDDSDLISKVKILNERVMDSAKGEKYITFFAAIYHRSSKLIKYVNCGHNPPLWIDENGVSSCLELGSVGLGMFDRLPTIESGELMALPGSSLICYTDGPVEQENAEEIAFGMSRMEKVVRDNTRLSLDEMHVEMVKELSNFRGETPLLDDTALLSCRFK